VGWIASILVLASDRFRTDTRLRFHAFQGLYLFAVWMVVEWVFAPALWARAWGVDFALQRAFHSILQLVVLAGWIVMLIKVGHGEDYRLPVLGDLADRSVSEQGS
jgi:uncharacterized membrane protein